MAVRIEVGINDLATTNPAIAAEWHPTKNGELTPDGIGSGSAKKVWWLCQYSHEWDANIVNRVRLKAGCPICVNQRVLAGFNDLGSKYPALAAEWHPTKNGELTPERVIAGSSKKYWWLGACGHEWEAVLLNRAKGVGCAVCNGKMVIIGFNDFASAYPESASEWHPTKNGEFKPSEATARVNKRVWWLGACGHEWETFIRHRTNGTKCAICSNQKVLAGFNDLASKYPVLADEWHPTKNGELSPNEVTAGTSKKYWWIGTCGHEWKTSPNSRIRLEGISGCRKCANQVSKAEEKIKTFLMNLGLEVEGSNRTVLKGQKNPELDIYIPQKKVAVEFNGIYWHSEKYRNKDFHYNKWLDCKNKGIQLIHIWEDDWNLRPEIIMQTLAHKLGTSNTVPVSIDTKVTSITAQQAEEFLKNNHLQGFSSGLYYLGVVETGDTENLRAVMVLGNRLSEDQSLEIIRYASTANISEDFSSLLSYAINAYSNEFFTVMADHCEANEEFYESKGFIAKKEFPPDYMYVVRTERKPRSEYSVERFREDSNLEWEEGLTERELADLNGLSRIWDAGKTYYRFDLKQ